MKNVKRISHKKFARTPFNARLPLSEKFRRVHGTLGLDRGLRI
jgi:hypothetical protein